VGLVEDDQPPLALVEQLPVAVHPGDLVGGDRDRPELLLAAVVLADVLGVDGGVALDLLAPLARELAGGDEDQRLAADLGERAEGGDGLPRAGRADEHAGLLLEEAVDPGLPAS